jgi:hypothetical protein
VIAYVAVCFGQMIISTTIRTSISECPRIEEYELIPNEMN